MLLSWTAHAWEEYVAWQQLDKKTLKRINLLLQDILRSPYEGIGKPEPLKFDLAGYWSRRIDQEHRLIYEVTDTQIIIIQCKFHY